MNGPSIDLLACQIYVPPTRTATDRDRHVERTAREVSRRLDEEHIDLVVLPELSSVEYSAQSFDCLDQLSEDSQGPSFTIWREVAKTHQTTILFGVPRNATDGCRITQIAVGPDGEFLGLFDKIHIAHFGASMEKTYFQRGDSLFIFEINGVRVAPIICYDIRIPELTRTLCLEHGVDLVLHCGAYARDRTFYSWHPFVVTRALENQIFVLSLNRGGDGFGSSVFCPPWVDDSTPEERFGDGEEYRRFKIDRGLIEQVRGRYAYLRDRLPDYAFR